MESLNALSVIIQKISVSVGLISVALAQVPSVEYIVLKPEPIVPVIESQQDVRSYIVAMADYYEVPQIFALWIAEKESGFGWREKKYNPAIEGSEPNGTISYGIWQFNSGNVNFSKSCSISLQCSTRMAMIWLKEGKQDKWSTAKFCREWFKDECPL